MFKERYQRLAIPALICLALAGCEGVPPLGSETTIEELTVTTPGLTHKMVRVPAGAFIMGTEDGPDDEGPVHQVHLDAFSIDKYEVTNEKYLVFVEQTGAPIPVFGVSDAFNKPAQPVVGIIWEQASGYCEWAGLRLPTEAEWEKAARGVNGQTFPWGDGPPATHLVRFMNEEGPSAVGGHPDGKSPFGAEDMAGNVWEFVRDHYVEDFYRFGSDNNPVAVVTNGEPDHTIRGGSWGSTIEDIRTTRRGRVFLLEIDLPDSHVGFRCATD